MSNQKDLARGKLRHAVRSGRVQKPSNCCVCSKPFPAKLLHGHHHKGYEYPLDVIWVCVHCHNDIHEEILSQKGADHNSSILTHTEVRQVHHMINLGIKPMAIASTFEVSVDTIRRIKRGVGYQSSIIPPVAENLDLKKINL